MTLTEIKEFLNAQLLKLGDYVISINDILFIVILVIATRLLLWLISKSLHKGAIFKDLDEGQAAAYYQIAKYVIIVIAIALGLESIGIKITFLLAGSAALLVGVGLGLQQLFNDLVSGFIILTEQTIKVGDIIELEGMVAKVLRIGLRTSKLENRSGIIIIVPNSKIINEKITNWSHTKLETRFSLTVGVAYGSDVEKVSRILKEAAMENPDVTEKSRTLARFVDFGDSALIFELLFWSTNRFRIEDVKSNLRYSINRKFIENGVTIPFPQRDLHFKSGEWFNQTK
jgi:small-conductance mechanosensitive channel